MISYCSGKIEDYSIILDLETQCFNQYDCFNKKTIAYLLKNPNNSTIVDIIKYNGMVAGYSVYLTRKNSKKIRLYSLCISSSYIGKKIASKYLEQRINTFSNRYTHINLEVRASNTKALNLYSNLGFQKKQLLPSYYIDGEDGYRLNKVI